MEENNRFSEIVEEDYNNGKNFKANIEKKASKDKETYDGALYNNEREGFSKAVRKIARKIIIRTIPIITEPFLYGRFPIKVNQADSEEQRILFQYFLNNFFTNAWNREEGMKKIAKTYLIKPKVYLLPDWIYEKGGTNKPTIKIIQPEKVTIDTTAEAEEDSSFIMYEEDTTYQSLERMLGSGQKEVLSAEEKEKFKKKIKERLEKEEKGISFDSVTEANITKTFSTKDWTRAKITVVHYYGYIGNERTGERESWYILWEKTTKTILKKHTMEFPLNRIPIYGVSFDPALESQDGESLVSYLSDDQKALTGIQRGIFDNLEEANNGTIFYDERKIDPVSIVQHQMGHRYISTKGVDAIKYGNFNQIPSTIFGVKNDLEREVNEIAGNTQGSPALSPDLLSQNEQKQMYSIAQQRQEAMVRDIGGLLRLVMKHILILAEWYLEDEQIKRFGVEPDMFSGTKRAVLGNQVATKQATMFQAHQINMLQQQSATLEKIVPRKGLKKLVAKSFALMDEEETAMEILTNEEEQDLNQNIEMTLKIQEMMARIEKLHAEAESNRIKGQTAQFRAGIDANESQSKIAAENAMTQKRLAEAQGHSIDNAYKPIEKTKTLEKFNSTDLGE